MYGRKIYKWVIQSFIHPALDMQTKKTFSHAIHGYLKMFPQKFKHIFLIAAVFSPRI